MWPLPTHRSLVCKSLPSGRSVGWYLPSLGANRKGWWCTLQGTKLLPIDSPPSGAHQTHFIVRWRSLVADISPQCCETWRTLDTCILSHESEHLTRCCQPQQEPWLRTLHRTTLTDFKKLFSVFVGGSSIRKHRRRCASQPTCTAEDIVLGERHRYRHIHSIGR